VPEISGGSEVEMAPTETVIRQLVDNWSKAIRARDVDAVVSTYAHNNVSFDVEPPLRYAGVDNKRRAWERFFAAHEGDIGYDVHELTVEMDGGVAFVHSLNHVTGTLANGKTSDQWVRWTACLRQIGGTWLFVHDHVSVPADVARRMAVLDLTP
jgi:uncharacterized protein (TIGR02246 family)